MSVILIFHSLLAILAAEAGFIPVSLDGVQLTKTKLKSLDNGAATVDSKISFEDALEVELNLKGKEKDIVQLQRQDLDLINGFDSEISAIYASDGIVLQRDCLESENTCKEFSLIKDGETMTYVNAKGHSLVLPAALKDSGIEHAEQEDQQETEYEVDADYSDYDEKPSTKIPKTDYGEYNDYPQTEEPSDYNSDDNGESDEDEKEEYSDDDNSIDEETTRNKPKLTVFKHVRTRSTIQTRRTRSVEKTRIVKLLMFVDQAVVDRFLEINDNDPQSTRDDIARFLALMCNSMTMHYQTLKEHGKILTVNGKPEPMDIAIQLAAVDFPRRIANYTDLVWIEHYKRDGNMIPTYILREYSPEHGRVVVKQGGAHVGFSKYMVANAKFYNTVKYDHAITVTGQNLTKNLIADVNLANETIFDLLGVSWMNSMCRKSMREHGFHTSLVELTSAVIRTAAHELGHAFGMRHDDGVKCPGKTYLMHADSFLPREAKDTFFKFSECSALDVENYTKSINESDFEDTCLQQAETSVVDDLCKKDFENEIDFDTQCMFSFGVGSKRVENFNFVNEFYLQKGYVPSCIFEDKHTYPFVCTKANLTGQYVVLINAVPGTKCVLDDKMDPDNICYQGRCVKKNSIC